MGGAAYVGRVGGLAVALGVGTAVFAGQGVAWADDTDSRGSAESSESSSATSDNAASEGSSSGSSGPTAGKSRDDSGDGDADGSDADEADAGDDEAEDIDLGGDGDDAADSGSDDTADGDTGGDISDGGAAEEPTDDAPSGGDDAEDPPQDADPDETTEPDPDPAAEVAHTPDRDAGEPVDTATKQPSEAAEDTPAAQAETTAAESVSAVDDPAQAPKETGKVAVFANASTLAAATTTTTTSTKTTTKSLTQPVEPKKYTVVTAVVNVVNSMIDWARQQAAPDPGSAPQPPFMWALLSFARRELETLFAARSADQLARRVAAAPTSLALTADPAAATLAADPAAAAALTPYSPFLNPQLSASTNFVSWVTGPYIYSDSTEANTNIRFDIYGTDVGTMWDNGMVDDPSTPWNEHQILIAVGDSFGSANMTGRHIYNSLFRSSDDDLSDGMTIPDGEWFNGNMFGGAPLDGPTQARPIINRPSWLPNSVTLIPTAGVSLPTEVTEETPFGTIQYVSFMSVSNWGSAGRWSTNYSAIAYSTDNGENFTVAPESVRYNSIFSGNKNFQQSAFVKGDDGYVYMYGTPNGRQGAAYLARVTPENILDADKYEYYKKASSGWFGSSSARWVKNSPSSASAIIGKSGGACGSTKPGYTVSEMSVQYNDYLEKYVVMYGDQFNNVVIRTSDTPQGEWSDATVLITQQSGGIYAPMMHPWSPSTVGTGSDLYWNLSLWSDYNIMLMRTDLTKI